jgi:hypothetical protein
VTFELAILKEYFAQFFSLLSFGTNGISSVCSRDEELDGAIAFKWLLAIYMCTVLLPPGGYPIAVNKYIVSYIKKQYSAFQVGSCTKNARIGEERRGEERV